MSFYIGLKVMINKIKKTAGGVVYKDDYILLIKKNKKWDLPKGKIEKNATKRETATQEIHEETGIPKKNLVINCKLASTKYLKKIDGEIIIKHTIWYAVKFHGRLDDVLIPDFHEGITKCRWVSIKQLDSKMEKSFPHIIYIINYYLSLIRKDVIR